MNLKKIVKLANIFENLSSGCPNCGFVNDKEGNVYDLTYPCPSCGKSGAEESNSDADGNMLTPW